MEDGTIRKIVIKAKGEEGLESLLKELGIEGEIEVRVMIKDTKQNYSLLSLSPIISDWDFITAEETKQEDNEEETVEGILKGIEKGDWNGIAWRIEAVWKTALKSPAVIFQSGFFWNIIKHVPLSITPEHAILVKLSEARWSGWEWEDVDQDLTEILNNEWRNGLEKKSLIELSRTLYGR